MLPRHTPIFSDARAKTREPESSWGRWLWACWSPVGALRWAA